MLANTLLRPSSHLAQTFDSLSWQLLQQAYHFDLEAQKAFHRRDSDNIPLRHAPVSSPLYFNRLVHLGGIILFLLSVRDREVPFFLSKKPHPSSFIPRVKGGNMWWIREVVLLGGLAAPSKLLKKEGRWEKGVLMSIKRESASRLFWFS